MISFIFSLVFEAFPRTVIVFRILTGALPFVLVEKDEYEQFTQKKKPSPQKSSKPTADATPEATKPTPPPPAPLPPAPAPKPKRLGIFSKRNADARETDINALVAPNAQAPDFAALLA